MLLTLIEVQRHEPADELAPLPMCRMLAEIPVPAVRNQRHRNGSEHDKGNDKTSETSNAQTR
jgi:hypothetical protein